MSCPGSEQCAGHARLPGDQWLVIGSVICFRGSDEVPFRGHLAFLRRCQLLRVDVVPLLGPWNRSASGPLQ